jgi:hypothetical protein
MLLIWRLPNNVSGLWNSACTACTATCLTQLPEAMNPKALRARAKFPTTSRKESGLTYHEREQPTDCCS